MIENINNTTETTANQSVTMNISASVIDMIMAHYAFLNLADLNEMSLYIVKTLAQVEKDGYKLAIYKTDKDGDKMTEMLGLDIHELIASIRLQQYNNQKKENTSNENNNM